MNMKMKSLEPMSHVQFKEPAPFDLDPNDILIGDMPFKSNKIFNKNSTGGIRKMANKVTNFSDFIHRLSCCLLHPANNFTDHNSEYHHENNDQEEAATYVTGDGNEDDEEDSSESPAEDQQSGGNTNKREMEMVTLMGQVFETVSSMKKAYVSLQEAHFPWDADKMRLSDVAVVTALKRLGFLTERFRRNVGRLGGRIDEDSSGSKTTTTVLRAVVAPYEAALEKLKTEMKGKEVEVDALRRKLKTATANRSHYSRQSKRRVSPLASAGTLSPASMAVPELFEACMNSVKEGSRSFASLLLSLMKAAHWDINATVRSIVGAAFDVGPHHAKYSLESYINWKLFQGFDHETYYMDGSLSHLRNPNQFRSECFTHYTEMKSMDPMELLGILPTCQFGKFCSKKYLSIVHPKMEESLFGDLEQRRQVLAGNHPRSRFYREFLGVAKAVWLLHLVAFSLDPLPSHFEGSRGAEFHPEYMETVVRCGGGRVGGGQVVGFPVSPGFKLQNGYVVKAKVYLVPKSEL
ncbi:hypothetical protein SSX86_026417 [Deinandra increscens subsp. villosa]|uniref:DUF641 domain-containing protein n=1 Tax=Deinandra increscens subsp. villosa TaxID=3103831 RepID=A0AAP0GP49_9ASTR